jgi:hypothetical protein
MVGSYTLANYDNCRITGVRASHLVLYPDGTYDQNHEFETGEQLRVRGEHWSYRRGSVRLNNFHLDPNQAQLRDAGADVCLQAQTARPSTMTFPDSARSYMGAK